MASDEQLFRLIRAARGINVDDEAFANDERLPLPCFPLNSSHFYLPHCDDEQSKEISSSWQSPDSFHRELCNRIRSAKQRVILATLYVGAANSASAVKEEELLGALEDAASNNVPTVKVLMDASRGSRPLPLAGDGKPTTCSAEAVHNRLHLGDSIRMATPHSSGVFLFNVLPPMKSALLPSPLNEVAGVFHMKAYVIDDCLILSGANLSEEYFTTRQDRFIIFQNGAGGLVDFYANLIDSLCAASHQFSVDAETRKYRLTEPEISVNALLKELERTFRCALEHSVPVDWDGDDSGDLQRSEYDSFIVPTFQIPSNYIGGSHCKLSFLCDTQATHALLSEASRIEGTSVRLASAYLNPPASLLSILAKFGSQDMEPSLINRAFLLTASPESHGFAPKKGEKCK